MPTALSATLGTIGGIAGLALVAWPVAIWWEVRCRLVAGAHRSPLAAAPRWHIVIKLSQALPH
jgi:hypothetical protein